MKARMSAIPVGLGLRMVRDIIVISALIVGIAGPRALAQTQTTEQTVEPVGDTVQPAGDWGKEMCMEPNALVVGHLAYMEIKLELTAAQRPLWDKWRQAVLAGAKKERAVCLQDVASANGNPTIVERSARSARALAAQSESLKAAQPALEALYEALTPEQKVVLDRSTGGMAQR